MKRPRQLFIALAILAGLAWCGVAGSPAALGAGGCPRLPATLSPKDASHRFTMLIRVNQLENALTYTSGDETRGGLAHRIRPQDVFVINTRFQNPSGTSNPTVAAEIAATLRSVFPCNRIIALNGVGPDPAQPGYIYALADAGLYGVMLDWEPNDWSLARWLNPGMPRWTYHSRPALRRIGGWIRGLSQVLAGTSRYTRAGLVPLDARDWDYGRVAQTIDRHNRRVGGRHRGLQSVQTQVACMAGPRAFRRRAKRILGSYHYKLVKRKRLRKGRLRRVTVKRKIPARARPNHRNLALQISFSDTPDAADPLPVRNVGAAQADRCVAAGLAEGAGSFFFFASDNSMRQLFAQPTLAWLRPSI